MVLAIRIDPGPPSRIASRVFVYDGPAYRPDLDLDEQIGASKRAMASCPATGSTRTRSPEPIDRSASGSGQPAIFRAAVSHQILASRGRSFVYVRIASGPQFVTRYEGLVHFDADQLDQALDLEHELDRSIHHLAGKVVDFNQQRGFLDVEVDPE